MARIIYTVGGHLATLYNNTTGLSSVEVTDPNIILRYYTRDDTQSGARYDGITYEGRIVDTTNACYYSTQLYAKPKLSDLTAAKFVSASELTAAGTFPEGGRYRTDGTYYFPYDTNPIGCYVIPKSAYSGDKELYVYVWLPSIESNPTDDDATYIDATMLAMESVGTDIIKCDVKNTNAEAMFNQTYISSMSGVNIRSNKPCFGEGSEYPNTASYPNIECYDSYPIVRTEGGVEGRYMLYAKLDKCSGTYVDRYCVSGIPIVNSNVVLAGYDSSGFRASLSSSTATLTGYHIGCISAFDSELSIDGENCYLTANNCSINVLSRTGINNCFITTNYCNIDLNKITDVYGSLFTLTATSSTLSGMYDVMIDRYHAGNRTLVECTGYDPETHKIWYFENYPTIPPEDITPVPPLPAKTLQVDLVTRGVTWINFNINISAENYTTSYVANSYKNSSFSSNENVHLPIYAKASKESDDITAQGFSSFKVSGLDETNTFRAATLSQSGYKYDYEPVQPWSRVTAFSAIYV